MLLHLRFKQLTYIGYLTIFDVGSRKYFANRRSVRCNVDDKPLLWIEDMS